MRSDFDGKMSAGADQNHASSFRERRLELTVVKTATKGENVNANPCETSVLRLRILQSYAPLRSNPERERVCMTSFAVGAVLCFFLMCRVGAVHYFLDMSR